MMLYLQKNRLPHVTMRDGESRVLEGRVHDGGL